MSFVISNCNYCKTKNIRFDNKGFNKLNIHQWDILAICSHCNLPTVYRISRKPDVGYPLNEQLARATTLKEIENLNLSSSFHIGSTIVPPNNEITPCPEHVPENIKIVFDEATTCLSMECYTASGAMFRLCLDVTTKELLQEWLEANEDDVNQPNTAQKDKLFNRIEFLLDKGIIPSDLKEYAHQIRLDGNDSAHDGNTEKEEAEDLLDFSVLFLDRIYTIKKQLAIAQARTLARRSSR